MTGKPRSDRRALYMATLAMVVVLLITLVLPHAVRADNLPARAEEALAITEDGQAGAAPEDALPDQADSLQQDDSQAGEPQGDGTQEQADVPQADDAPAQAAEPQDDARLPLAEPQTDDLSAQTDDPYVRSWRGVYDALERARTTSDVVYIEVGQAFKRQEGDPDLVMRGGNVVLDLKGFVLDPRVNGKAAGNGRALTIQGGTITVKGTNTWQSGFVGGSSDFGGAILVDGGELRLEGCTIQNNSAKNGGGIAIIRGKCSITGGELRNNTASQGGAIYVNAAGSLSITGGQIYDNQADLGGGIYVNGGQQSLSGGELRNNSAQTGGGAYVGWGELSIEDGATVKANKATESGGNLAVGSDDRSLLAIRGGSVREGSAVNGGGAAVLKGKLLVLGGTIESNTAVNGAGLAVLGGTAPVEGGSVVANVASQKGGGAYVSAGTLSVRGGAIQSNRAEAKDDEWGETATAEGGGIFVATDGSLELAGSPSIASNTRGDVAQDVFLDAGRVIAVTGSFVPASSVQVDVADLPELDATREIAGEGPYGEGAFACAAPDCELVYETPSTDLGHALIKRVREHEGTRVSSWADLSQRLRALGRGEEASFWLESDITFGTGQPEAYASRPLEVRRDARVTIDLNGYAINRGLAAREVPSQEDSERCIYVSLGTLVVRDGRGGGRITGGCCQRGGGIFVAEGSLVLESGTITGNKASYGGGVYVGMGSFELLGGRICENVALAQDLPAGGGVYVGDNSNLTATVDGSDASDAALTEVAQASMTMRGGSIDANKAAGWGAGVCVSNGTLALEDGTISGNAPADGAEQGGGGVYVTSGSGLTVTGGTISNNQLRSKEGAGIAVMDKSTAVISGGTITGNTSTWDGGGICVQASSLELRGATISRNVTSGSGGGIVLQGGSTCLIESGILRNNLARTHGGAVMVYSGAECTMTGGEVAENQADKKGVLQGDDQGDAAGLQDDPSLSGPEEFCKGGGFEVKGKLTVSGGTITRNNAIIGCGICLDGYKWPDEQAQVVLSGSPNISDNFTSALFRNNIRDITLFMDDNQDETTLVAVEGRFDPPQPVAIDKDYRNQWEYIALVDEGDYDLDAFKSAQDQDMFTGESPYVLVKRDGVLYAYRHEHSWVTDGQTDPSDREEVTCKDDTCVFSHTAATFTLSVEGLADGASSLAYDGKTHAACLKTQNVPADLEYSVEYAYHAGSSAQGDLLDGPPSKPGAYTVVARLKVAGGVHTLVKTFEIRAAGAARPGGSQAAGARTLASTGTGTGVTKLPATGDGPTGIAFVCLAAGSLVLVAGLRCRRVVGRD